MLLLFESLGRERKKRFCGGEKQKQKAKSKKKKKKKRCDEQGGSVAVFKRLSLPLLSLYRLFIVYCILKKTDRARAR